MRESVTYQAILDEGRAEGRAEGRVAEARALLALLGEQKFGPPDARVRAALEALARRLLAAISWDDLLRQPQPGGSTANANGDARPAGGGTG